MKAHLLYEDRDFDWGSELPPNAESLTQDLGLDTLLAAMAMGDEFLHQIAEKVLLSSLTEPTAITYRQEILRDCLERPELVRPVYDLTVEALQRERRELLFGTLGRSPGLILSSSVRRMELFVEVLERLRSIVDEHSGQPRSPGLAKLFETVSTELSDQYFETVKAHLGQLRFPYGTLMSAELGKGMRGRRYVLHKARKLSFLERLPFGDRSSLSFEIADRDEAGSRALGELRDRGVDLAADVLAQSGDHIRSFFQMLQAELAFYIGSLNLHQQLATKGEPTCFPNPLPTGEARLSCRGLYDVALSLNLRDRVVGNEVDADSRSLLVVTGANQGGKSTFLRSVGLAQLMMQSGMFVAAESFAADVRDGVFTHFKREEDASMESGKLDEELSRMSDIVDQMGPRAGVLLCNESFASTNEREGSEIAEQIIRAVLEQGVKVVFVTHMYELAQRLYSRESPSALFLRAERERGGHRTFRMVEGAPLPTSHGEDVYERIFGVRLESGSPAPLGDRLAPTATRGPS